MAIYGRNLNFYITLAYSWTGNDDSNPEHIAQITATHQPDLAQVTLSFGQVSGSNPAITELKSIETPDGELIDYYYDVNGNLTGVDKPGNNPILPSGEQPATQFCTTCIKIPVGNLPETYDVSVQQNAVLEVCGPRAATGMLLPTGENQPPDGACVDFESSGQQLSAWWTRGVLNPTPDDSVVSAAIQPGSNTGFVQWNDTAYFSNNTISSGCSGAVAEMTDTFGHTTNWCLNGNNLVTATSVVVSGSNILSTSQGWDSNNDLVSTTDARGNTTNIAYDTNGNVSEVSLPKQTTANGSLRPT